MLTVASGTIARSLFIPLRISNAFNLSQNFMLSTVAGVGLGLIVSFERTFAHSSGTKFTRSQASLHDPNDWWPLKQATGRRLPSLKNELIQLNFIEYDA